MLRVLLTIVLPLVLPTALYLLWVRTTQWEQGGGAMRWRALPWLWLAGAGVRPLGVGRDAGAGPFGPPSRARGLPRREDGVGAVAWVGWPGRGARPAHVASAPPPGR